MWCQLTVEFVSVEMTRFERMVLVRSSGGRGHESRMSPARFGILSLCFACLLFITAVNPARLDELLHFSRLPQMEFLGHKPPHLLTVQTCQATCSHVELRLRNKLVIVILSAT